MISTNQTHENEAILILDVNIDDTNRLEKLEILAGQNPKETVDSFCEKFNIVDVKKDRLHAIIEERLKAK